MSQPAKVQEPSMEEILASIRRIIADDEAKPPAAEKASAPAKAEKPPAPAPAPAPKPVMKDIPPSKLAPPKAAAAPPPPTPPPPAPAAADAADNNQDDIDALLAGLDEATSPAEVRASAPPEPADSDVLELTDEMAVAAPPPPPQPAPSFRRVEPKEDLEFAEAVQASPAAPPPMFAAPSFDPGPSQQAIMSHSTVSAVESAFNALANTVLSNNARTLEDLVKEMLRPMLKSWLDDNLPGMVERIVKAEIERVSRGR